MVENEHDLGGLRKDRDQPPLGQGEGGEAVESERPRPPARRRQRLSEGVGAVGQSQPVAEAAVCGQQLANVGSQQGGVRVCRRPPAERLLDLVGRSAAVAKLLEKRSGDGDHPGEPSGEPGRLGRAIVQKLAR